MKAKKVLLGMDTWQTIPSHIICALRFKSYIFLKQRKVY